MENRLFLDVYGPYPPDCGRPCGVSAGLPGVFPQVNGGMAIPKSLSMGRMDDVTREYQTLLRWQMNEESRAHRLSLQLLIIPPVKIYPTSPRRKNFLPN